MFSLLHEQLGELRKLVVQGMLQIMSGPLLTFKLMHVKVSLGCIF